MKKLILLTLLALPCLCFGQVRFVIHKPFSGEPLFCNDAACLRKAKTAKQLKSRRRKKHAVYTPHSSCLKQTKPIVPITTRSSTDTLVGNSSSVKSFQSAQVLFPYDEFTLDSIGIQVLNELVPRFLTGHVKSIDINGHTDSNGSLEYNRSLSLKRAQQVQGFLIERGVPAALLHLAYFSFNQPALPNTSTNNRSINRRVEIHWTE